MILKRAWTLILGVAAVAAMTCGNAAFAKGGGGGGHGGGGHGGGGHGGGRGGAGHAGAHPGGGGSHGGHGGYGGNRGYGYGGYGRYGYGYYPYGVGIGLAIGYGLGSGYGGYGNGGYGYTSGYNGYAPYDNSLDYYYGQQPPPGYDPSMAGPGGGPGVVNLTDADVLLNVRVPANATVWVNGGQTTQTGPRREFMSSGLTPGKTYNFEIRAQWEQGGKVVDLTRKVPVQGGERRSVDFMSAPVKPPLPPAPKPLPPDGA